MYKKQEDANEYAKELIKLRSLYKENPDLKKQYLQFENQCFIKFQYIIDNKIYRYKNFSNFQDLKQEGYEALTMAIKTYDVTKGSFTWWAERYVKTRIFRSANAHSTIRFPLKKAKEERPYKVSTIPVMLDLALNAEDNMELSESNSTISDALEQLPDLHKKVISMIYGFEGQKSNTIDSVTKELALSRTQFSKILREAKKQLKETLTISV